MNSILDNPVIKDIEADTSLTPFQRKLKLMPFVRKEKDEIRTLRKDLEVRTQKVARMQTIADAARDLLPWCELKEMALEKNDCSRLHRLVAAIRDGRLSNTQELSEPVTDADNLFRTVTPFVVEHDWAAAFRGSEDFENGEIRLPYEFCAFEFRFSGRNVIVSAFQTEATGIMANLFVESGNIWFTDGDKDRTTLVGRLAWEQVRAICIALDAEVAAHEIVRAPSRLNAKREQQGKPPLFSYAVVRLNGAHRMNRRPVGLGNSHRGPRLHFRRGHWRHYLEHKTWIRWTLVGNPDMGFVDKEYRL